MKGRLRGGRLPVGGRTVPARALLLALVALCLAAVPARALETATVTLPSSVTFWVTDVAAATTGSPSPTPVEVSDMNLAEGAALRILVQAESAELAGPAGCGDALPASSVGWTASGAWGGTATSGSLDAGFPTLVLETVPGAVTAGVDLTWSLAAPGPGVCAGDHSLTVRWTLESISP